MARQLETAAYFSGLYEEVHDQYQRYQTLTKELMALESRIELAERQMALTRDYLAMIVAKIPGSVPEEIEGHMKAVRFVGVRLADACLQLLQEKREMTVDELVTALGSGMYRFRTSVPTREIWAALMRQSKKITKEGDKIKWKGPAREGAQPRLKIIKSLDQEPATANQ